jgi:hypothetical protein
VLNLSVLPPWLESGNPTSDQDIWRMIGYKVGPLAGALPRLLDVCLIAMLALTSFAVIMRVGLRPSHPATGVAVVYSPWTTAGETIVRSVGAGARFVRRRGFHRDRDA